jgi:hypothetical protein
LFVVSIGQTGIRSALRDAQIAFVVFGTLLLGFRTAA